MEPRGPFPVHFQQPPNVLQVFCKFFGGLGHIKRIHPAISLMLSEFKSVTEVLLCCAADLELLFSQKN